MGRGVTRDPLDSCSAAEAQCLMKLIGSGCARPSAEGRSVGSKPAARHRPRPRGGPLTFLFMVLLTYLYGRWWGREGGVEAARQHHLTTAAFCSEHPRVYSQSECNQFLRLFGSPRAALVDCNSAPRYFPGFICICGKANKYSKRSKHVLGWEKSSNCQPVQNQQQKELDSLHFQLPK